MNITFLGAAREVTGSCHLIEVAGRRVLLDCGLFQGRRAETAEKNKRLPLPPESIDAIVLSHAHIDHAGRLPFLASRAYAGPIYATPATRDLSAVMLADCAHIQEKDAEHLARHGRGFVAPLYSMADATRSVELMIGEPYHHTFDVVPGVQATFYDAGHILGSASVVLDCAEGSVRRRFVFSGDIGRSGLPIIRDPQPPEGAEVVVMESTYGNRDHESVSEARAKLGEVIRRTAGRGGRVLVPAFAVGRTQELLYDLHALARAGAIPRIPVIVDSPLATDSTSIYSMHPDVFDRSEDLVAKVQTLLQFDLVRFTRNVDDSKALNSAHGPMVIIAASGMAEAGRILHHLLHGASDPRNTILIVGFQAEHTLGRRIVERQPELKIFGDLVPLRATVEILNGYSAHADRTELGSWISRVAEQSPSLRHIYLVHGEPDAQDAFAAQLAAKGLTSSCPAPGEQHEF